MRNLDESNNLDANDGSPQAARLSPPSWIFFLCILEKCKNLEIYTSFTVIEVVITKYIICTIFLVRNKTNLVIYKLEFDIKYAA